MANITKHTYPGDDPGRIDHCSLCHKRWAHSNSNWHALMKKVNGKSFLGTGVDYFGHNELNKFTACVNKSASIYTKNIKNTCPYFLAMFEYIFLKYI